MGTIDVPMRTCAGCFLVAGALVAIVTPWHPNIMDRPVAGVVPGFDAWALCTWSPRWRLLSRLPEGWGWSRRTGAGWVGLVRSVWASYSLVWCLPRRCPSRRRSCSPPPRAVSLRWWRFTARFSGPRRQPRCCNRICPAISRVS